MLVYMLSKLIFIHRDSIGIQHNHTSAYFQGPVEDLYKVTDLMKEDLDSESDDDDDE